MPLRRNDVFFGWMSLLSFLLLLIVECYGAGRYANVCPTGQQQRVSIDENGHIFFRSGHSIADPEGNATDNMFDTMTENSTKETAEGGRWLRRSTSKINAAYIASSSEGVTSTFALPWMRHTQQQGDRRRLYDEEYTVLPTSLRNASESQLLNFVRPCLCHPKYSFKNYYAPNETVPDLYLCDVSATFCGIPYPGSGPVECLNISVPDVVATNTWRIVVMWYFCLILIGCCTMHAINALNFGRSLCDPRRNSQNVDRILASRNESVPSIAYWNLWAWQNYRFEQNLLLQTGMVLRSEDMARDQQCREQGLPPPPYEMKTKRYSKDDNGTAENHGDDNSVDEPACTICFVPLENGDIVGDLACQHIFHKDCLKSWCARKNACPLCHTILATRRPYPQPQDIAEVSNSNTA